ncbi:MAG: zinc-ribbon domain-containing protein [Actinobacteria bacterium]|nr:zinc-ribbon domain-containing protein [Actinomycetota bacterium]
MPEPDCPHCGTPVPANSRFCPECGRSLETGLFDQPFLARPGWTLWPPDVVVVIAVLVAVGGLILMIGGAWAWGLVALLAAVVLVLARTHLGTRTAVHALADVRARAAATREAMAARSREQVDVFRARRELAELHAERTRLFRDLGYAVYHEDETGTKTAREEIATVEARIGDREAEIEALRKEAVDRVERAQGPVRPTEPMDASGASARVPEPWPPPDEGDLPGPPAPAPGEPTPGPEEPAPPMQQQEHGKKGAAES